MLLVAGLSLSNLRPKVWDKSSPYYLPRLKAVMVSFVELEQMPNIRKKVLGKGLHEGLGIPEDIDIYLDNGAFYYLTKKKVRDGKEATERDFRRYDEFVQSTRPSWYVVPRDYIPTPQMSEEEQLACFQQTMEVNKSFVNDGYVPVIHIGRFLDRYLQEFLSDARLSQKQKVALGGIVPNLLRTPKAMPYQEILDRLWHARAQLSGKQLHVFGIGGVATLHLAALLGIDSVDSSGWRNRAAYGLVQLPGKGERMVANLGSWRGRVPEKEEWNLLENCQCPACQRFGTEGLRSRGLQGFCNRATHNLWVLLEEARQIEEHLKDGTYGLWYREHVENSVYRPLIDYIWQKRQSSQRNT